MAKKLKKKEDKIDTRLSYSSATLIKNCEQKYFWYKVAQVAKDADSEDNDTAFNVGKCFHYVLEENNHSEDNLEDLLISGCKAFAVEDYQAMLHAMLLRYLQVHYKSELEVIHCELAMSNNEFIGFIDVIMKDYKGYWWIVDLKTASRYSEITAAKLHNDVQLNLYSYFADLIACQFDLDPKKFAGARYRVTTKSTIKSKAGESYTAYVKRLAKSIKSYDIIIPIDKMNPKGFYNEHMEAHARSLELRAGEAPKRNFSYCDSFFRPCEYFSQCHGKCYSDLKNEVEFIGSSNV